MVSSRRTSRIDKQQAAEVNNESAHLDPALTSKFEELAQIVDRHDDRTRLLFHLDKFVSLVYYNPQEAKRDHSDVFERWRQPHDLWEAVISSQESRLGRRKVAQVHTAFNAFCEEKYGPAEPVEEEPVREPATTKKRAKSQAKTPSKRVKRESVNGHDSNLANIELPPLKPVRGSKPAPKVTHPIHVVAPKFGGNLDSLLATYKSTFEDQEIDPAAFDEYVQSQAVARQKVVAAQQSGLLEELQRLSAGQELQQKKFTDPNRAPAYWDNLTAQAAYLGKVRLNLRKYKQGGVKKIAQAVEQYFRRLAGAEEKEKKDLERSLRQQARKIASDVLKKWKLAEKVVLQRRQQVLEEENRVRGKEYLNQILEKSAQLLESRIESYDPEDDTESEVEKSDADRFSESNDESDGEDVDDDAKLTVEELREKYKDLPEFEDQSDVNMSDAAPPSSPLVLEAPSKELLELYNQVESSHDEESLSSSDEESLTDSESESESEIEPAAKGPGLAALFGGKVDESESEDYESEDDKDNVMEVDSEPESKAEELEETKPEDAQLELRKGLHKIDPPFLLRGTLREYQRDGLDWLVGLYNTETNGILADEMGLGKTIQTISLLAYLACEKHIWGPHLIVVPTSVMLNWEMEFKRFAPGFKVLTYYGNPQQRKEKRRGWNKEDTWHVCITSYQLVIQDQVAFRRKRWCYMILDEAHNIKNFRSQRWQGLLNFNSERRLLLTGTPLQNNLVELWSLLYFLMPSSKGSQMMPAGFANLQDFQEWFARPVDQMVEEGQEADDEAKATIAKLHQVLRPYLLRRLKADVEKQMPGKYEHIVYCRLSKRQRYLYDDFMSRAATKATLASGNFLSILNCLMQLRKVCNHPDLFEVRPVVTSLAIDRCVPGAFEYTARKFAIDTAPKVNLDTLNLLFPAMENKPKWEALTVFQSRATREMALNLTEMIPGTVMAEPDLQSLDKWAIYDIYRRRIERAETKRHSIYLNMFRTNRIPLYGSDLVKAVTLQKAAPRGYNWDHLSAMDELVLDLPSREASVGPLLSRFAFVTPAVVTLDAAEQAAGVLAAATDFETVRHQPIGHESQVRLSIAFPDKRLLQYDCGKLQKMATLLHDLIFEGHRVLIFTQMTKVLDILEQFLNIHGWRYLRLDGATRVEQRQVLTERFNKDASIPVFILSTRSGGLGINLTGADTVIFYDSDWNPAMDKQCQDRCHRIGQTRDVHIYRLVSEFTIESNILRKATQKTILDNVVIQEGDFTTDYFNRITVQDLLGDNAGRSTTAETLQELGGSLDALGQAEDDDDRAAASIAMGEARMDQEEFEGKTPTPALAEGSTISAAEEAVEQTQEEEEQEEDEIGHVDDYMIRFIERGDFFQE